MNIIKRVREKPILWDLNHMYFRDVGKKRDTWDLVAEECGMRDGEEARQAWAKLRNSHREAMRRRLEDKQMKPWKYEKQMEFLLANNPITKRDITVTKMDNEPEAKYNNEDINVEIDYAEPDDTEMTLNSSTVVSRNNETRSYVSVSDYRTIENFKTNEGLDLNHHSHEELERDGLNELFSSLCTKTRNLPKHLQIQVQREIFGVITRAEEEALTLSKSSVVIRKRKILRNKRKLSRSRGNPSPSLRHTDVQGHKYSANIVEPLSKPVDNIEANDSGNGSTVQSQMDPLQNIIVKTDPCEESSDTE